MNFSLRVLTYRKLLVTFIFLFILTSYFILHTSYFGSALAAPGESPNPQPCENVEEGPLTDNWITDENGNPPIDQVLSRTGDPGETLTVTLNAAFTVDFSKLQAIFGPSNSNYLEGRFQDQTHRDTNILDLKSVDFNKYHGPGQKAAPKVMVDQLKVKFVEYVYEKPELAESANKYADINGQNPKTIYDMVKTPNFFYPPQPPSWGGDADSWNKTWGRYWEKIPTAYSEFYEGKIEFRILVGKDLIDQAKAGNYCPQDNLRVIKFVMPEFFRTTATTGQLNQIIVPQAAQSKDANNLILKVADGTKTTLAKILEQCVKAATQNPLSQTLRKVIKITFNNKIPQLIKNTYAAENPSCVKITTKGKEGTAPYCALPAGELKPGDSCTNQNDSNKLNKDNPNVICTFRLTWTSAPMIIGQTGPGQWDRCDEPNPDTGEQTCYLEVAIWPVIRIPWLSEIWNNTLYSNEDEGQPGLGVGSQQLTGRPGVYSFFIPKAVAGKGSLEEVLREIQECFDQGNDLTVCQKIAYNYKGLPGEIQTGADIKERFIGGTDCNKEFTRDVALKPKALQDALGIKAGCQTGP